MAAATVSAPAWFEVSEWRPFEKGTLKGFWSLTLPSGLVIHGLSLHQKTGRRWLSMPARPWRKDDSVIVWNPVIEFASKNVHDKFQSEALKAVDEFLAGGGR